MISFEVDTAEIRKALADVSIEISVTVVKKAVDETSEQLRSMMSLDAASAGYSSVGQKSSASGWKWSTSGRIPRSIKVSKKFRKGKDFSKGDYGRKVFSARSNTVPYSNRARHTNLVVHGFRQFVPTGVPGKGNVRRSRVKPDHPANKIFNNSILAAQKILEQNVIRELNKTLKKLEK